MKLRTERSESKENVKAEHASKHIILRKSKTEHSEKQTAFVFLDIPQHGMHSDRLMYGTLANKKRSGQRVT